MLEIVQSLVAGLGPIADSIVKFFPLLLSAVLLLVVGWIFARVARSLTLRSAQTLNRGAEAIGLEGITRGIRNQDAAIRILANIVYWLIILFFLTAATNVMGLSVFTVWLEKLVSFLPNIISGGLIIFAGAILSKIARDATTTALTSLSAQQRLLAGRFVQGLTWVVLIVVGLDQIGFDITVIITVLGVAVGAFLGGLSLAFGLGARTFVSNVIGAHYIERDFDPGQRVRIQGHEGTILEITSGSVHLETREGRLVVPAHIFAEGAALLLTGEGSHD